jgi:hypothetical protein
MRVLHISDLHARDQIPIGQQLLVEKLLEDVASQERERPIDLVVFSGDCAFDGTTASLQSFRTLLLEPLRELLPGRRIVFVPGNHDVDRARIDPIQEQGMRSLFVDQDAVGRLLAVDGAHDQALLRLQAWRELHQEWHHEDPPLAIPLLGSVHVSDCDNATVGIAALNTAWRSSDDEDRGRLLVGEEQIRIAMNAIAECDIRLVVMHHPLEWLADFDEALCRQLLEANHCFVFTGHDHKSNPAALTSSRGSAVYSRGGCLYETRTYPNSYTMLDLELTNRHAVARVRRWWPQRDSFGAAEDLVEGGEIELPWPEETTALPAAAVPTIQVLGPLATIAREVSVIVQSMQLDDAAGIPELLIAPTFWPLPDDEAHAAEQLAEVSVEPVDALSKIESATVTVVSGAGSSGVTSALLWLLDAHFRSVGSRLPRFQHIDERISSGRLAQTLIPRDDGGAPVPLLIALDDAMPREKRAFGRLKKFIEDHPEAHFVLGCHGDAHSEIVSNLSDVVTVERVFLRPLRRKDLRALVTRVYGAESRQLTRKVLAVLDSHRLPRNALNMAALVAVAAREPNLSEVNETGLFDAYVSFLLENGRSTLEDPSAMDQRLREGLLERFAYQLVHRRVSRLSWPDAEQFVIDFVKTVGWAERGSPAKVLEGFIESRVLIEDGGIGFRHAALRDLFAAKWMLSNPAFASEVLADCLEFPDIIRHATGLRRDRPDLLETVGAAVRTTAARFAADVELAGFDHARTAVKLLPDPLTETADEPREQTPSEDEIDEIYDELERPAPAHEDHGLRRIDTSDGASAREVLSQVYSLLAAVVKNSELVDDIQLKARELREVIHGWSVLALMLTADAEAMRELTELLTPILEVEEHAGRAGSTTDITEQLASMLILALLAASLEGRVGTPRLQAALIAVLDDEDFMSTTLHALFAVILYASLRLPGWPARVGEVYERHGQNALVVSMLTQWTLFKYRTEEIGQARKSELEELLADILVASGDTNHAGPVAILGRARSRAQVLEWLRRGRLLAQERLKSSAEDTEDDEDPADEPDA